MMRAATTFGIGLALGGGCYAPTVPSGVVCDPSHPACPAGELCVAGACEAASGNGDVTSPDAAPDAAPAPDTDGDGLADDVDNCPLVANPDQDNYDGDRFGDACDPCPPIADNHPGDRDGDGVADACDPDPDTPGDAIVVFDTFRHGTAAWSPTGTWTVASDGVAVDARGTYASLALTPPGTPARATIATAFTPTELDDGASPYAGLGAMANAMACEVVALPSAQTEAALVATTFETAVASTAHALALGDIYTVQVTITGGAYRCRAAPADDISANGSNPAHPPLALRARNARGVFHWALITTAAAAN